jgi:CTP:molybdopterin cytidylyltransferase MocA
VIEELERTLQEAREGDISEIILVVEHRNPKVWSVRASHIAAPLTWIGRLEVAKQDLITSMREPEEET